jgi:guanylate cyclase
MLSRLIRLTLPWVARVGADPTDSDEVRLEKSTLVLSSVMFLCAGFLWGGLYFAFGQGLAASIPTSYSVVSLLSVIVFHLTRRYNFLRFSQLVLILVLPFLLMIALGGFVKSSGVILWAVVAPLGALVFDNPRRVLYWLAAYLGLVALSGIFESNSLVVGTLPSSAVTLFFVMNIGGVSAFVVILLTYFVSQKNLLFGLLHAEQAKSENLLLNILPKEIAAILKNESRTIADHYDSVSVLFADMVGFTRLSEELAPVQMVELLNEAFSFFDSLLDKYGVEKIRTIGDNYMVTSGVPRRRPDHAQALVRMALEMRDYSLDHIFQCGRQVSFRMGINSGPVIAGVIGSRKFVYDVWGDAVNVASRMESHGLGGAVQITRATYELIQEEFVCEPRGVMTVKSKGEMEVWLVLREQQRAVRLPQENESAKGDTAQALSAVAG